ncbi:MAG: hypothetical protein AAB922_07425 [Patescibacteria group bacterium]
MNMPKLSPKQNATRTTYYPYSGEPYCVKSFPKQKKMQKIDPGYRRLIDQDMGYELWGFTEREGIETVWKTINELVDAVNSLTSKRR